MPKALCELLMCMYVGDGLTPELSVFSILGLLSWRPSVH